MDQTTSAPASARDDLPFQADFPAEEFERRRSAIVHAIGLGAVAVLRGAAATGAQDLFRQTNDFYYLCGVEVPGSYLLIDGATRQSTLYLPPRDPHLERHEGPQMSCEDAEIAMRRTGVHRVRHVESLVGDLAQAKIIFTPKAPAEGRQASRDSLEYALRFNNTGQLNGLVGPEAYFRQRLEAAAPAAQFRDLSPILDDMRLIKSPREIELLRRAGKICALAIAEAMRRTRPGMMEYQLAAVADYVYGINGCRGGAYRSIVAAGRKNIWNTHYYRNNSPLRDGDWVLMDYAPDLGNYCSDIGRFWPINGRYSPVQRELYGFMIQYHKTLLGLIRPGPTPRQILDRAAERMKMVIDAWPWSKTTHREAAIRALEYRGHLSHPVGMAVHDVGKYWDKPLRPGLCFALDPQLWAPEEQLYVRVEDTVVVTEDGVENLTSLAPLEMDDVEKIVGTAAFSEERLLC